MDFVRPPRQVSLSLLAGLGHYEAVLGAVAEAEFSLWIATANLKELYLSTAPTTASRQRWHSALSLFDQLARRGVELRILHAALPSRAFREAFDSHPRLIRGGLQLRQCPRVHLKTVIVDARLLYLGSANWTGAGLGGKGEHRRNFELGITTTDEGMIDDVQALYQAIWSGQGCGSCRLRDSCDSPLDG
jgi:phosphatidylserine/phosphatidylglycerophosphate/cardiolipin synthase-like enzyme